MEKIAAKVHKTEKGHIAGVCDARLIGKKLEGEGVSLDITERFYFEKHIEPDDVHVLVEGCMSANIVGPEAVNAYCKKNPEAKGCVKHIGGVPHLLVFKLD
jgi:hypothetical protein